MRNRTGIALAALAIGGFTWPPTSVAQTREAADAALLSAPPVADADSVDAPVQGIQQADPSDAPTQADITGALAKPDAGAETTAAPAQAGAEARASDAPAKPEAGAAAADAPAPSDADDWTIGVPARGDEEAEATDAPARTDGEADTVETTWESVIQVIEEALAPAFTAESREAADAAEAIGPADTPAGSAEALAEAAAEPETYVTEPASEANVQLTDWVVASHDNGGLPFIVIDKVAAALFVYDPRGELLGVTPALLGISSGDETAPGIGELALSAISVDQRTTPAGRFAAQYGFASGDRRVLWVDFDSSLALHPVVTANRSERRPQRLRSPTPEDNRITFGCINVPAQFYTDVIQPLFDQTGGIVYILPESHPLEETFPALQAQASSRDEAPL